MPASISFAQPWRIGATPSSLVSIFWGEGAGQGVDPVGKVGVDEVIVGFIFTHKQQAHHAIRRGLLVYDFSDHLTCGLRDGITRDCLIEDAPSTWGLVYALVVVVAYLGQLT